MHLDANGDSEGAKTGDRIRLLIQTAHLWRMAIFTRQQPRFPSLESDDTDGFVDMDADYAQPVVRGRR